MGDPQLISDVCGGSNIHALSRFSRAAHSLVLALALVLQKRGQFAFDHLAGGRQRHIYDDLQPLRPLVLGDILPCKKTRDFF